MSSQKAELYRARYNEDGFQEYIDVICSSGLIEGKALGIAKQVVDRGFESLSFKQKFVFETDVMDEFYVAECDRCGEKIVWEEMSSAYDSGFCSYCEHVWDKMMAE
ncbi:MAG: hypothetical protein OHK0022_45180 [Roseiflexaceae bacterium]